MTRRAEDDDGACERSGGRDSLLTERQAAVLRLRKKGLSQQEVAEILGTTRSNVSILEKRAQQNVFRARATLRDWTMIQAPVSVEVPAGTDIFEVPALVFSEADRSGIKLGIGSVDIIVQIKGKVPEALNKRVIVCNLVVAVTEEGLLLVREAPPE